jgi:hypothetical protein
MNFIDEDMNPVSSKTAGCVDTQIFEFSIEDEDYMLRYQYTWDVIEGDFFNVRIGELSFDIPAGTYILCSCPDGNIDWIMIDELIGRDIQVLTISKNLRTWTLNDIALRDYRKDGKCYFPMSKDKAPIPVTSNDCGGIILVSSIDQHNKMKDKTFEIFFV